MSLGTAMCTKCKALKSPSEFRARADRPLGRQSHCKECEKAYAKDHPEIGAAARKKFKKKYPEAQASFSRTFRIKHPARSAESTRKYHQLNPEIYAAHVAVGNALKDGRIIRLPCLCCGNVKTEAHHSSYAADMKLAVTWLCHKHHQQIHTEVRLWA